MDQIGFRPVTPTPKRSKNIFAKAFLSVFAVSLFFWQSGQGALLPTSHSLTTAADLQQATSYLAVSDEAPRPPVFSVSYLLLDPATAEVVIAKNAKQLVPIASTTKMVTALVARELFELDDVVEVTPGAAATIGSDIQLVSGEKITVHNLLRGLLIQSGNDAAFALAQHYQGSDYRLFVEKMNAYVREHGLNDSVFGDPAGLDDEIGRSTAWDLAHVARLVLEDPVLAEIVRVPTATISSIDGRYSHELKSSNRLLLGDSPYYLPGAIGVKTGFTPEAGHCLVAAYNSKHGLLIGVVLNTAEYTITASASESRKLFQWADSYLEKRNY